MRFHWMSCAVVKITNLRVPQVWHSLLRHPWCSVDNFLCGVTSNSGSSGDEMSIENENMMTFRQLNCLLWSRWLSGWKKYYCLHTRGREFENGNVAKKVFAEPAAKYQTAAVTQIINLIRATNWDTIQSEDAVAVRVMIWNWSQVARESENVSTWMVPERPRHPSYSKWAGIHINGRAN